MRLITGIKKLFYFFIGQLFVIFLYKRKYINGRYFEGKFKGVFAQGWEWLFFDSLSRLFQNTNKTVPWPVSGKVTVVNPANIIFDLDDLHIFHTFGTYFQAINAKIYIGKGSWIAPNVGLITTNHDFHDLNKHLQGQDIIVGKNNWIGMNSIILPGVVLGDNTIVGAGSIVTKSFKEGNCVIAGNPAKKIKEI